MEAPGPAKDARSSPKRRHWKDPSDSLRTPTKSRSRRSPPCWKTPEEEGTAEIDCQRLGMRIAAPDSAPSRRGSSLAQRVIQTGQGSFLPESYSPAAPPDTEPALGPRSPNSPADRSVGPVPPRRHRQPSSSPPVNSLLPHQQFEVEHQR